MKRSGSFAERLREYLVAKGMYQRELVDKVNQLGGHVLAPQVTMYLKGQNIPRVELLSVFASAMGVSIPWLLGYDISSEDEEFLDLIHSLNSENKQVIKDMIAALKVKQQILE